jgi:Permuted papain-like amidase enzyme, YaeF/YiiX, C92 family
MKKLIAGTILICATALVTFIYLTQGQIKKGVTQQNYQEGDVIFQSMNSRQCEAVRMATHSDISHCGILFKEKNEWYVLEAVEPVSVISLDRFMHRGNDGHYSIKRLTKANNTITADKIKAMHDLGHTFINKHYDIFFNWSNDELYCSELVWKLYHDAAGIDICPLRKLKDYDLSNPLVKQMMKERYGDKIPLDEGMVAPSDLSASEKLELVEER